MSLPKAQTTGSGSGPQSSESDLERLLDGLDLRLRFVWNDIAEFARAANIATQC